jgi:site-specific recombinase XerD
VGLADILGHDNLATTQIYVQKPLGALQDEIEKAQFFQLLGNGRPKRSSSQAKSAKLQ